MKSILLFCLSILFFSGKATAQDFLWAKQAGGIWPDEGYGICADPQGNTIVTGEFGGNMKLGTTTLNSQGGSDIFIAKYDASGNVAWATSAGGEGWDTGASITCDSEGNIYLTGYFEGTAAFGSQSLKAKGETDIFIAKYTAGGKLLWVRQAGGSGVNTGKSIKTDTEGNVFVTGAFSGQATFGSTVLQSEGFGDIFLLSLDTDGNVKWVRKGGGWKNDEGRALALDQNGNIFLTGIYSEQSHFDGQSLFGSRQDIFVAKYTPQGALLWLQSSSEANEYATYFSNGIEVDAQGNSYITGYFQNTIKLGSKMLTSEGEYDIFLAKLNKEGKVQWATSAGGAEDYSMGDEVATGICIDPDGNPYISGKFYEKASFGSVTLSSRGGSDIFVAKYSTKGEVIWAQSAGGDAHGNGANAICRDRQGNLSVTGSFYGDAAFDKTTLNNVEGQSSADVFVARLTGNPGRVITDLGRANKASGIQAFPNPFTSRVSLEFTPLQNEKVTFDIVDMRGSVVARLYEGEAAAGRPVNLYFEANDLPNGVYIGKLTSGSSTSTTRLVLTK